MITLPKEIKNTDELLLWFMSFFNDRFKGNAILKGGMILRLLNSPRNTNDLDYLFVPFVSKKEVFPIIEKELSNIEGIETKITVDSKCLSCKIRYGMLAVQIEVTIADSCQSESVSNASIIDYNVNEPQIITIQKREIALAHKIIAWFERGLYRDLYDIYFFISILDVSPDTTTIYERLESVQQGRVNKTRKVSIKELLKWITEQKLNISQDKIELELSPLFDEGELAGMDMKMKVALVKLMDELG